MEPVPTNSTQVPKQSDSEDRAISGIPLSEKLTPESAFDRSEKPLKKHRSKIPKQVVVGGILVLGLGMGAVYRTWFYQAEPKGIFFSGRIEGHETDVSAKMGGRVALVAVREGDLVKLGQLLVKLDDADIQAQLQGAIARVRAAQERLQRTQQQLPVLQTQLEQARLTTQQAIQDSEGRVLEAQNSVATARSQLAEAKENLTLAQVKQRRTRFLYTEGAVSAQDLDEDNAILGTARARVAAAQQQVDVAQGRLKQAQATAQNSSIRATQELQIQKQIAQAQTDISISAQEVQAVQADRDRIRANLNYLSVNSPLEGTVMTRSVEPGEVVAPGTPLLTLVNQNQLYFRGFIAEGDIGNVKVGQSALVYLDSAPDRPLDAKVSRIDPKASFTPENTYFKKDRVTQVFGVELNLVNPQGLAKQGMPADGRILLPESQRSP